MENVVYCLHFTAERRALIYYNEIHQCKELFLDGILNVLSIIKATERLEYNISRVVTRYSSHKIEHKILLK